MGAKHRLLSRWWSVHYYFSRLRMARVWHTVQDLILETGLIAKYSFYDNSPSKVTLKYSFLWLRLSRGPYGKQTPVCRPLTVFVLNSCPDRSNRYPPRRKWGRSERPHTVGHSVLSPYPLGSDTDRDGLKGIPQLWEVFPSTEMTPTEGTR